ncbi:MAG: sulfide/dihydroorotate dehydrogenase-like FAD/NAD-binding protein [Candidatus Kariarchaeaceae archaeon]
MNQTEKRNLIVKKEQQSPEVILMEVKTPLIAKKAQAGQFVIIRVDEVGERFPLTIADSHPEKGTIEIAYQMVGASTRKLGLLKEGDYILNVAGPLGKPTHIEDYKEVIVVGGGVGIACTYPIMKTYSQKGVKVISIIGARNKDLLIMKERIKKVSDELFICTDDGTEGRKGFVTNALEEIIAKKEERKEIGMVFAVGPPIMMKFVSEVCKRYNVPITVSLNTIMVDGTGCCGGCRVTINREIKFACVDGPEFDGSLVDWEELLARIQAYDHEQRIANNLFDYKCRMGDL